MVDLSGYQIDSQAYPPRCPGCGSNQDYTDSSVEDDFEDVCFRCDKPLTDLPICANCRSYLDGDWAWCAWCRAPIDEQDRESARFGRPFNAASHDEGPTASTEHLETRIPVDTPMFKVRNLSLAPDYRSSRFPYFEILRGAFDQRVHEVSIPHTMDRDSVIDDIVDAFIELRETYNTFDQRPEVKFHEERFRKAYLLYSAASNGYFTESALARSQRLTVWLKDIVGQAGEIRVCTLGGGPGSEILGLAQWIISQKFDKRVVVTPYLTDKNSWVKEWEAVKDSLNAWLSRTFSEDQGSWPMILEQAATATVDIKSPESLADIDDLIPHQDLFLFSYSLSELFDLRELRASVPLLSRLADSSKQGAKFLIVDVNQPTLRNNAEHFVDISGMRILEHTNNNVDILSMPGNDRPDILGDVFKRLRTRGHYPRTRGKAFWIVAEKRG